MPTDWNLIELNKLREDLRKFLHPQVLNLLVDFLESCGKDNSLLERYSWFCEHSTNGPDCRYAKIAKNIFENDEAKKVAEMVVKLYHGWAKQYEVK